MPTMIRSAPASRAAPPALRCRGTWPRSVLRVRAADQREPGCQGHLDDSRPATQSPRRGPPDRRAVPSPSWSGWDRRAWRAFPRRRRPRAPRRTHHRDPSPLGPRRPPPVPPTGAAELVGGGQDAHFRSLRVRAPTMLGRGRRSALCTGGLGEDDADDRQRSEHDGCDRPGRAGARRQGVTGRAGGRGDRPHREGEPRDQCRHPRALRGPLGPRRAERFRTVRSEACRSC